MHGPHTHLLEPIHSGPLIVLALVLLSHVGSPPAKVQGKEQGARVLGSRRHPSESLWLCTRAHAHPSADAVRSFPRCTAAGPTPLPTPPHRLPASRSRHPPRLPQPSTPTPSNSREAQHFTHSLSPNPAA